MSLPLLSVKHRPERAFVAACSKCSPMASLFIKPVCTVSPESWFFPPYFEFYCLCLCMHLLPAKGTRRFVGGRGTRRFIPWPREGWLCDSVVPGRWGPVSGLAQGTSPPPPPLLLLCWGGSCGVFGKGQVAGDGHSSARPALLAGS